MLENAILFEASAKGYILDIFDKATAPGDDGEEFVVEKSNPSQRVLTADGEEVELKRFGGIMKGSEIMIRSDLISLIKLVDRLK